MYSYALQAFGNAVVMEQSEFQSAWEHLIDAGLCTKQLEYMSDVEEAVEQTLLSHDYYADISRRARGLFGRGG